MKVVIRYEEITNVIEQQCFVHLQFRTVDSKTIEVRYRPNRFISMSINLHIEAMHKDVIYLSYDCSSAMSLIISGVVTYIEDNIPHGVDIDINNKRINIYPERFDEINRALEYLSLTDISFYEDNIEVSLSINTQ